MRLVTGPLCREFDVIILGATGFTGKYVTEYLARKQGQGSLTWAIAGRNKKKLKALREETHQKTKGDCGLLEADISDPKSLRKMSAKGKVVLNCVGPYSLLGEPVVEACLSTRSDYLDISGEPYFLENMQRKYMKEAIERKTLIIGSCGFDSIPADLGVAFLLQNFPKTKYIESYLEITSEKGVRGNYPTWLSLVNGYHNYNQLKQVRAELFSGKRLAYPAPLHRKHFRMKKGSPYSSPSSSSSRPSFSMYVVPFPGSDRSVIARSQLFNSLFNHLIPIRVETYFVFPSVGSLIGALFGRLSIGLFKPFAWGRKLLREKSSLFTFGLFVKNENPTQEQLKATSFQMLLKGNGKELVAIKGPEPGYVATPICLVEAALTLLSERDKVPLKGGVLTPGFAFKHTSLIERLHKNGVTFENLRKK